MPTHYPGNTEEVRALNAFIPLVRAVETVASHTGALADARGLSASQFGVLEALLHLGPLCQRELGQKLLKSGGNMTLVVDNLERKGWVRRERQTKDRRMFHIRLTPRGRRIISRMFPEYVALLVEEMRRLTATEQEQLRNLCRKLGRGAKSKE